MNERQRIVVFVIVEAGLCNKIKKSFRKTLNKNKQIHENCSSIFMSAQGLLPVLNQTQQGRLTPKIFSEGCKVWVKNIVKMCCQLIMHNSFIRF